MDLRAVFGMGFQVFQGMPVATDARGRLQRRAYQTILTGGFQRIDHPGLRLGERFGRACDRGRDRAEWRGWRRVRPGQDLRRLQFEPQGLGELEGGAVRDDDPPFGETAHRLWHYPRS